MLNFRFSEMSLGLVSPSHFAYDFSSKMFLMLDSINSPYFIVSWPIPLEILGNICIKMVSETGCDVIKFEINLVNQAVSIHDQKDKTKT